MTEHNKINRTIRRITSDALPAYKSAYKAEFLNDVTTKTENPPKHNFAAGIRGLHDNNMIERLNNTLREMIYRGLKIDDTPMLPLYAASYFIKGTSRNWQDACKSCGNRFEIRT
ncbi:MAG: hypothetical protein WCF23_13480 [Candidatus Nitrosopolaris sp.]